MDDNDELAGLLIEARKGNEKTPEALGALLAHLRPWLRRQAQALLGQRLAARLDGSDIVQEVHLRAFKHFHQFQGDSVLGLQAWIAEILRNMIIDCRRRQGAGKRDREREVPGGDLFAGRKAEDTTPSQGAMRNERQAMLEGALQQLPEKQRLVFQLRLYEQLPFEEVARRVDVTADYARVLMVRAVERLQRELRCEHE